MTLRTKGPSSLALAARMISSMTSRVVHFEIPIDEPDRAGGFYRKVFGWLWRNGVRSTTGR